MVLGIRGRDSGCTPCTVTTENWNPSTTLSFPWMFTSKESVLADPMGARDECPHWIFKKNPCSFWEKMVTIIVWRTTSEVGAPRLGLVSPVWEILDRSLPGTVRKSLCKKFTIPVLPWTLSSPFNLLLDVSPLPASVFVIVVIITSV